MELILFCLVSFLQHVAQVSSVYTAYIYIEVWSYSQWWGMRHKHFWWNEILEMGEPKSKMPPEMPHWRHRGWNSGQAFLASCAVRTIYMYPFNLNSGILESLKLMNMFIQNLHDFYSNRTKQWHTRKLPCTIDFKVMFWTPMGRLDFKK